MGSGRAYLSGEHRRDVLRCGPEVPSEVYQDWRHDLALGSDKDLQGVSLPIVLLHPKPSPNQPLHLLLTRNAILLGLDCSHPPNPQGQRTIPRLQNPQLHNPLQEPLQNIRSIK